MIFFKETYDLKRYEIRNIEGKRKEVLNSIIRIKGNVQPISRTDFEKSANTLLGVDMDRVITIFIDWGDRLLDFDDKDYKYSIIYKGFEYFLITKSQHFNQYFPISYVKYYAVDRTKVDANEKKGLF